MISSSQRPIRDNTQHSQQTDIHATGGIRTHNPSHRATHALDRAATGPSLDCININKNEQNSYAYSHKMRLQILAQFEFSWTERFADCRYKWGRFFSNVISKPRTSKQFRGQWHWILSALMSVGGDSSQNAGRLQSYHFLVSPDPCAEGRGWRLGILKAAPQLCVLVVELEAGISVVSDLDSLLTVSLHFWHCCLNGWSSCCIWKADRWWVEGGWGSRFEFF